MNFNEFIEEILILLIDNENLKIFRHLFSEKSKIYSNINYIIKYYYISII